MPKCVCLSFYCSFCRHHGSSILQCKEVLFFDPNWYADLVFFRNPESIQSGYESLDGHDWPEASPDSPDPTSKESQEEEVSQVSQQSSSKEVVPSTFVTWFSTFWKKNGTYVIWKVLRLICLCVKQALEISLRRNLGGVDWLSSRVCVKYNNFSVIFVTLWIFVRTRFYFSSYTTAPQAMCWKILQQNRGLVVWHITPN